MADPAPFRRSSVCESTNCVEVFLSEEVVLVRNSTKPGHKVEFTKEEWDVFVKGVKNNEFDTP